MVFIHSLGYDGGCFNSSQSFLIVCGIGVFFGIAIFLDLQEKMLVIVEEKA